MDEVVATQQALREVIKNFATALQWIPEESWTLGMARVRTETLQGYWMDFQSNHRGLLSATQDVAEMYEPGRAYSETEQVYFTAQALLYDVEQRPSTSTSDSAGDRSESRFDCGVNASHARLPQINVPTFSGRREDWESFRDLFRAIIHEDQRLSDVSRFYYLKTHVQGDAKAALDSLQLTSSNYASAWRLLESRYEHHRLLVQVHITALCNLRPLRAETSAGLQTLLDTLTRHRDQLQALKRPVAEWDDWFTSSHPLRAWTPPLAVPGKMIWRS